RRMVATPTLAVRARSSWRRGALALHGFVRSEAWSRRRSGAAAPAIAARCGRKRAGLWCWRLKPGLSNSSRASPSGFVRAASALRTVFGSLAITSIELVASLLPITTVPAGQNAVSQAVAHLEKVGHPRQSLESNAG